MGTNELDTAARAVVEPTDGSTRRRFLRALAAAGTGASGLRRATEAAFGSSPDGVPVVWTRDEYGRPDRIRYVPKERYRRLEVFRECRPDRLRGGSHVNELRLESRSGDPEDLSLKALVDRDSWRVRRKLPNRVRGVPVTHDERRLRPRPGRICEELSRDYFDPLRANVEVQGRDGEDAFIGTGTLGLVGWNADRADPYQCLLTAHHVVADGDEATAAYLEQGGETSGADGRTARVGEYVTHSPLGDGGMDVVKYRLRDDVTGEPLATQSDDQPDVTGAWDFTGLTDATTGDGSVPVTFAGRSTCYATAECTATSKNDLLGYQAVVTPCIATSGDSGGPFVDPDGKLVGTFSLYCDPCDRCSGPVGTELLDAVAVRLSEPESAE